jgi:PAS domain S-box-containing protein
MWAEQGVEEARARIREVLEPAERLADKLQFTQARQMEAFYSFLLAGDPASRLRYREARDAETAALDTLELLTEEMSLEVRTIMANLSPLVFSWHLNHQDMLSQELTALGDLPVLSLPNHRQMLADEQLVYGQVQEASEDLRDALAREMAAGEAVMSRRRFLQAEYSQILVVLGLVSTLAVLVLAWRLRSLMVESELRRQDAFWARREADGLLQATGEGVLGMDPEGRCTFLNRAGADMLGYGSRGVVGKDVHDLLHHSFSDGKPLSRDECPIMTSLQQKKALAGRNEVLWRNGGEPFPVKVSLRPMVDGTEFRGAVLSFVDMTEIRAAEASLRQAVQARDEVLAVVSHDLRSPVGTIFSAASLLLTLDPAPEKRREHLLAVKRSAERMNHLIKDLLDVARLETGALPVHPGPFHAERLVHEVLESHRRAAAEKGIQFASDVPAAVPPAWGDRHRILQVLTNLVENAVRETPSGGEVTVGILEPGPAPEKLQFFVRDTGRGIRLEDQERLFDRFWQVSRTDNPGAGLGLSIVKGIVEAHQGEVWVESAEGKGSTFWFTLPAEPEAQG